MGLFGDGSNRANRREERRLRKEARQDARTERASVRQQGRSFRIGEGGGSNFADGVGALGNAVTDVGGLFAPGGGGKAPESNQLVAAGMVAPPEAEPLTAKPWFLPAAGVAGAGLIYALVKK